MSSTQPERPESFAEIALDEPPDQITPTTSSNDQQTWRSTMSNLIGRSPGGTSSTSPAPSPSFLLQRITSSTAARDRRISREMGATDKLREGFEKVRSEMEGVAREMRREPSSPTSIDWAFWGAVVQDYEEVARTQPKELSKAIQQGIPHVIR